MTAGDGRASGRTLSGDSPQDLLQAARLLSEGGVVALPTDTLYGLGASMLHPAAIERVFAIKRRPPERGVPVLLATAVDLSLVAAEVPRIAWTLIEAFWPGGLTLVLPARAGVPRVVTGGAGTIGVRVPSGRTVLQVLEILGEPVIGTSANRSGEPAATTAADVLAAIGPEVDAVLADDGSVALGVPSTVVEVGEHGLLIHRLGAISPDALRRVSGARVELPDSPVSGERRR